MSITIKISAKRLYEEYVPALQEIAQSPFPGKVAFAVIKNYQFALRTLKKIEQRRLELLRIHAIKDGIQIAYEEKDGARLAKFETPEDQMAFERDIKQMHEQDLFEMEVHRVDIAEVEGMHSVRPAAIIMLEPMFNPDPEEVRQDTVQSDAPAPALSIIGTKE